MDEDVLDKAFEPFYTTNRAAGNSGLGMHIVRSIIVDKLEGTLDCESQPGQGVRFEMRIPNK
jgi:signal transduction histidine kinase